MINLKKVRKDLHRIPELAFEEFNTRDYLLRVLKNLPDIKVRTFDFPALLVEYKMNDGNFLLFRADMDGLPITEETECDFRSTHPGKMHACGHDMHMSILLGLIEHVVKGRVQRNILFLFQPAEETGGGARHILEAGILDDYDISAAYALHVKGDYPVGTVACRPGSFFANTEEVDVTFLGRSAHVAFAEKGKDAVAAAVDFYQLLQRVIPEKFEDHYAILCKFGIIKGGTVRNAVPAKCVLQGTLRALELEDHQILESLVKEIAWQVAADHDLECEVKISNYYRAVVNDSQLYEVFKNKIENSPYAFKTAPTQMGGEDFGFLADKYTGLLFLLGADGGNGADLHAANFLPDENALEAGLNILKMLIE
ncbi:MAG: amidohydrolase [Candidatus Cloacimonetes bacterium]|nr:amidohydrolase [Candidatus Cloacimonadota bacterium]